MVNPCEVKGGLPVAFVNNYSVINFKEFGNGRIIAIGDDRMFAYYLLEKDFKLIDPDRVKFIQNTINYLANE